MEGAIRSQEDRNVLISVLGTSPPIVTETLYALTQQEGLDIHEVHVWTTATGRDVADAALRGSLDEGRFYRLYRDFGMDSLLPDFSIHVFRDRDGKELEDIRSKEDNAAMLDQLVRFVRDKADNPRNRLLCSLAGGRKTMSAALAFALQLHGHPGDRLFHVLVNPPVFESIPEFFYPPPEPALFVDREGNEHNSADLVIELAEVPLVFLQEHLPRFAHDAVNMTYTELVAEVQQRLLQRSRQPLVRIEPSEKTLYVDHYPVRMQPVNLALYALLAHRRLHCVRAAEHEHDESVCPECAVSSQDLVADGDYAAALQADLHEWLRRIPGRSTRERPRRWGPEAEPTERTGALSQTVSRIRRTLREQPQLAAWVDGCAVAAHTTRETTLYGLTLAPSRIEIASALRPRAW